MKPVRLFLAQIEGEIAAGRWESAQETLDQALRAHPNDSELHARKGLLLCLTQREPSALDHLGLAKGSASFDRLGQMLVDHFYCRRQMAKKLRTPDPEGERFLSRAKALSGFEPSPDAGIRLTACLITKNEESNLERCLSSLEGLADEIVVVDTGSTDRTVDIAEQFGAMIGRFEWIDDFSAARNESLRLATGHWVLWIDADEEVDPDGVPMLREGLMRPHFGGYFIQIDNMLGEAGTADRYVHTPVRMFRRLPGIEFTLRIHEQVLPSIERLGLPTATIAGAKLNHYGYTARAMAERNKLDRTISMLRREIEEQPDEPFHRFNLANALVVGGRWDEAARAASDAVDLMGDSAAYGSLCYHLLCCSLSEIGDAEAALARCDEADRRGLGGILIEYERVHALGLMGRYAEALETADRCLALDWPQGLNGDYGIYTHKRHVLKAQLLAQVGRWKEALELFEHALRVDPSMTVARYGRGVVLLRLGRLPEAETEFDACLDHPEYGARAQRGKIECLFGMGGYAEAAALLEAQWRTGIRDEGLFALWAEASVRTGDSRAVLAAFEAYGMEQEPASEMLINWGRALRANGEGAKALACFSEAIKRQPDDPNGFLNCGDLLYEMGQFGDAAHLYETALRLNPENAQAWFVLGNCLYRLGLVPGARIAWEQALRAEPEHAGALENLGLLNEGAAAA